MSRKSDRIFGLVVILVALVYIASALQVQTSFLADPLGPKAFPILVASVACICGGVMIFAPDEEPDWPGGRTVLSLGFSVLLLVAYAYALRPMGFLLPTAVAAGVLSYQISPDPRRAVMAGIGLSVGLFVVFRYALGLGLFAVPRGWMG